MRSCACRGGTACEYRVGSHSSEDYRSSVFRSMCKGRFPGRIVLYWAPSWIPLLPFGRIEGCSNWQSFTISQPWWRFCGPHSFFPLSPTPKGLILKLLFLCPVCVCACACVSVYLCAIVRVCGVGLHAHARMCICLNASLGTCLNGIKKKMVPVGGWSCRNDMGNTHTHTHKYA